MFDLSRTRSFSSHNSLKEMDGSMVQSHILKPMSSLFPCADYLISMFFDNSLVKPQLRRLKCKTKPCLVHFEEHV